jgi:phage baseplate assembly protein W
MANFKGFNTINQVKKFSMTDVDLIKRDLLNALLIREGQLPGRPEVGTNLWNYIFDPNDEYTTSKIEKEITRIIELDSRLELLQIRATATHNIIRANVEINILPNASVENFYINFLKDYSTATITTE